MPRGNWGIVSAAIFGLVAICFGLGVWAGSSPQPKAESGTENTQAAQSKQQRSGLGARTPVETVQTLNRAPERPPCGPSQYQSRDDLCAQWKAADAASDAAWWAMAGTIVAALGTLGLYWQIHLTRKAVEDTGQATQAMREANEIAEKVRVSQERQLRAHLCIINADLVEFDTGGRPGVMLTVKNKGSTIAQRARSTVLAGFVPGNIESFRYRFGDGQPLGPMGPGDERVRKIFFDDWDDATIRQIKTGAVTVIYAGIITYRDIFQKRRFTTFLAYADIRQLKDGRVPMSVAKRGNLAS